MRFACCLNEALRGLAANKLRYFLGSVGLIISVAAIVSLLTLGNTIDAFFTSPSASETDLDQINTEFSALRITLLSVMCVALLTGLISLNNALFASAQEQQTTIALQKSVGADSTDIAFIYLAQSVIAAVAAGVIGIVLGYMFSYVLQADLLISTVAPAFSFEIVALPLLMSFVLGILAGLFPAYRAANTDSALVLARFS